MKRLSILAHIARKMRPISWHAKTLMIRAWLRRGGITIRERQR